MVAQQEQSEPKIKVGKVNHFMLEAVIVIAAMSKPLFELSAAAMLLYLVFGVLPWVKERYKQETAASVVRTQWLEQRSQEEAKIATAEKTAIPEGDGIRWEGVYNLHWAGLPGTWWDVDAPFGIKKAKFKDGGQCVILNKNNVASSAAWYVRRNTLVIRDKERSWTTNVDFIGANGHMNPAMIGHTQDGKDRDAADRVEFNQLTGYQTQTLDEQYDRVARSSNPKP